MGAIKDAKIFLDSNKIDADTYDLGEIGEVTIVNNNKKKSTMEILKDFYTKNKNYLIAGAVLLAVVLGWKYFKK